MNKNSQYNSNYTDWANNIRFFATMAVVVFHVSSSFIYYTRKTSNLNWLIGDIIFSFTQFCVPFFFLLSGFLNLNSQYSYKEFFSKRIKRVLIPFLFWGSIFSLLIYYYQISKGEPISILKLIKNFTLFQGEFRSFVYHFWFIYALILMYLITPLLKTKISFILNNKVLFLLVWITSVMGYVVFDHYIIHLFFSFLLYLGYYIIGFLLKNNQPNDKKTRLFYLCCLIILGLLIAYLNYLIYYFPGYYIKIIQAVKITAIILISLSSFSLLKSIKLKNKYFLYFRDKINTYSYSIYILHAPILLIMEKYGFNWLFIFPIIGIPLISICCFYLSFTLAFLGNKIKYVTNFIGVSKQ